jgi:hypothetical protein
MQSQLLCEGIVYSLPNTDSQRHGARFLFLLVCNFDAVPCFRSKLFFVNIDRITNVSLVLKPAWLRECTVHVKWPACCQTGVGLHGRKGHIYPMTAVHPTTSLLKRICCAVPAVIVVRVSCAPTLLPIAQAAPQPLLPRSFAIVPATTVANSAQCTSVSNITDNVQLRGTPPTQIK